MGFWDSFKAQPAPEPVTPEPRENVVGVQRPDTATAPSRATYRVVGAWVLEYDLDASGARRARWYGGSVDKSVSGWVELDGDRRAGVGDTIELTREEAHVVGKRFALSLEA